MDQFGLKFSIDFTIKSTHACRCFLSLLLSCSRSFMNAEAKEERKATNDHYWIENFVSVSREIVFFHSKQKKKRTFRWFSCDLLFFSSDFHSLSPTALIFRHFVFFIVKLFRKLFNTFLLSFFFCCYWGAGKELWKENRMLLRYIVLGWFLCQLTLKLF